jgi:hypothetical protein
LKILSDIYFIYFFFYQFGKLMFILLGAINDINM